MLAQLLQDLTLSAFNVSHQCLSVCLRIYLPHVGPGQSPPYPSLPHLLLYLLVSFTFPFLTCFIYFLAFPSVSILPE